MKNKLIFTSFMLMLFSLGTISATIVNVKGKQLPAVYKTSQGGVQKVEVIVEYQGSPIQGELTLGHTTQNVELKEGTNSVLFEIPVQNKKASLAYKLSTPEERKAGKITVSPVRHWQMNLVQHTHTDIGYTRSQMEILAEHQRYIDYALDYCDATDDYPEFAQFKWTCEIAWAVSEYLKNKPAKQIERLKKRVDEGRIEIGKWWALR